MPEFGTKKERAKDKAVLNAGNTTVCATIIKYLYPSLEVYSFHPENYYFLF